MPLTRLASMFVLQHKLTFAMRNLVLCIANSLDNFIARENHAIDWLFPPDAFSEAFTHFESSIDTVLIGRKTYEVMLRFGETHYEGKRNIVFSRTLSSNALIEVVRGDVVSFVRSLKSEQGKGIWLVGGGELITLLLEAELIDEFVFCLHPILLGKGVPMFLPHATQTDLDFLSSTAFENGAVMLHYRRKSI